MWSILFVLAVAGHAISAPASNLILHEKRSEPSSIGRRRVHGDIILPVHIALTQSNLDNGYNYLMDVSDPRSQQYGKHWTTEQIHSHFAPNDETKGSVVAWLEEHGFHRDNIASTASNGWLALHMSVRKAEQMFSAEYYEQVNEDGDVVVACDEYHLPAHISQHVDYVSPGVSVSPPLKKTKAKRIPGLRRSLLEDRSNANNSTLPPDDSARCGEWITPRCLKALYGIPDATLNQPENKLGVYANGDTYDQEDIDLYLKHYAPWVPPGTHPTLESINGAKAPVSIEEGGVESVLDFDLSLALLYPQEVTLYQTQSTSTQEKLWIKEYGPSVNTSIAAAFLPFVDALDGKLCTDAERKSGADCGTVELKNVLSVSYGYSELQTPERAAKRICAEFMKLALKGHTLLLATQDQGVGLKPFFLIVPTAPVTNGCIAPNHIENPLLNGTVFNVAFPATCPFVTAVGGTQLHTDDTANGAERAMFVHDKALTPLPDIYTISTGGGVSNYFPTPDYQKSAVDEYFSKYAPAYPTYEYEGKKSVGANGGIHAIGGRSIPDLSANAAHMPMYWQGTEVAGQAGTSLSTPIVASMITLINQQRTLAGKGPVGFINPVIYQNPEAFTDITTGQNPGCGTDGFPASKGWDASTGLGTPIYPKLLEVFMALP